MSRQPQGKSLSQPTSRVGNLERRRRDAIPGQMGSGSGTQRTESGSSHSTRTLEAPRPSGPARNHVLNIYHTSTVRNTLIFDIFSIREQVKA